MTTADQIARMQHWLDTHPAPTLPRDPAADMDEDTLRRSFGGPSRRARREQRTGRYGPTIDADGIDRDGWAHGAEYPGRAS